MLYFGKDIAKIPSNIYEPIHQQTENAEVSYQYPYYITINISDNLDIPEFL